MAFSFFCLPQSTHQPSMQAHQHLSLHLAKKETHMSLWVLRVLSLTDAEKLTAIIEPTKHDNQTFPEFLKSSTGVSLGFHWVLNGAASLTSGPFPLCHQFFPMLPTHPYDQTLVLFVRDTKRLRLGLCPSYSLEGRQASASHGRAVRGAMQAC